MSELFGIKVGNVQTVAANLEPLLEVRFRKISIPRVDLPWMIALSKDRREHLVVLANKNHDDDPIDASVEGYEALLYLVRSWREERLTRLIATETRFRFVRPMGRVQSFVDAKLAAL